MRCLTTPKSIRATSEETDDGVCFSILSATSVQQDPTRAFPLPSCASNAMSLAPRTSRADGLFHSFFTRFAGTKQCSTLPVRGHKSRAVYSLPREGCSTVICGGCSTVICGEARWDVPVYVAAAVMAAVWLAVASSRLCCLAIIPQGDNNILSASLMCRRCDMVLPADVFRLHTHNYNQTHLSVSSICTRHKKSGALSTRCWISAFFLGGRGIIGGTV